MISQTLTLKNKTEKLKHFFNHVQFKPSGRIKYSSSITKQYCVMAKKDKRVEGGL